MPAAQDKVNKKAVGKRIRSRRLDLGLQQVAVADGVGVKAHHLLRWEKGEYLPKADRLQKLSTILRTSVPWLLNGRGRPEGGAAENGVGADAGMVVTTALLGLAPVDAGELNYLKSRLEILDHRGGAVSEAVVRNELLDYRGVRRDGVPALEPAARPKTDGKMPSRGLRKGPKRATKKRAVSRRG